MATKLKNSKLLMMIISFLFLVFLSFGIYNSYDKINENVIPRVHNYFEDYSFYEMINNKSYQIYFEQLVKTKENKTLSIDDFYNIDEISELPYILHQLKYEDGYISQTSIDEDEFRALSKNDIKQLLNSHLDRDLNEVLNLYSPSNYLYYLAINKESGEEIGDKSLAKIIKNSTDQALKEDYQYYVVLDYDANGVLKVNQLYGADFTPQSRYDSFTINPKQEVKDYLISSTPLANNLPLQPIKNTTLVYAVPKVLPYYDYISKQQERYYFYEIQEHLTFISVFICGTIFIFACLIPLQAMRKSKIINHFLNWPIETLILTASIPVAIFIEALPGVVCYTLNQEYMRMLEPYMKADIAHQVIMIFNVGCWFLSFTWIFMLSLYIKNLFVRGFKVTLTKHSLIYQIFRYLVKGLRFGIRKFKTLLNVDLKEENTKKLFLFIGVQFIILSLCCLGWFFGNIPVFIYSILLYYVLRKYLVKTQNDYAKLMELTKELANGNLDVEMNDDLGMFNSFKDEVVDIQQGFKKAVEAEVRSQRMKTDLITNVSHDLKTPLTSIITYTDLLKDDTLDDNKRVEYLEILDQKAQRLKVLIEDLFEMSKASSGNISLNLQPVDVASLMKQTLLELEDKIHDSNLIIRSQIPEHKVMLMLDSERTFRIFDNLILNMTKYSLPQTRAYIDILEDESQVQIMFRNISADEIKLNVDELTERFVRGDQARHTEGSGLGLAIAKSFVELQGGSFEIQIDGDLFKVILIFNK